MRHFRLIGGPVGFVLALLLVVAGAVPAQAAEINSTKGFRRAVTVEGIREHQWALQQVANANNGTRASGTPGYDSSAAYIVERLTAAGYNPVVQPFQFPFYQQLSPSEVAQVAPTPATYTSSTFQFSPPGDVVGLLVPVDTTGSATDEATSGCEPEDYAGFPQGAIALVQRGPLSPPFTFCGFAQKVLNAQNAGASAVIVFNRGTAGNTGVTTGTLGEPGLTIPVAGVSFATGQSLYNLVQSGPVTMRVATSTISEFRNTSNIIAETPGGDPDNVIVIGAHLDSVAAGPGIQDNGSGSSAILEIAEVFAAQGRETRNRLRFAWWGAEELNLLGSTFYVAGLSQAERDNIRLNLNFDMIGSPNYVRFVYDGNGSSGGPVGPAGSGAIEQTFRDYFASEGLPVEPTPFNGRSDYGPFIAVGIPAGGLFTGAEVRKTAAQAAIYGGTAGIPFDPCYHQACDTYDNISLEALDQMSDAAAHAVLVYSKWNFAKEALRDPPAVPEAGSGGGGGLHEDDHDDDLPEA